MGSDSLLDENQRRLWQIARRVLSPERTYSKEHVLTKPETYLKVSPERAEKGFSFVLKEGVLTQTLTFFAPRRYCLGDTSPLRVLGKQYE